MSIGHTCKNAAVRKKINDQVNDFVKAGGEIITLPFGIRKEDKVNYNSHAPKYKTKK